MITTNASLLRARAGGDEDGWKTGTGREKEGRGGPGRGAQGRARRTMPRRTRTGAADKGGRARRRRTRLQGRPGERTGGWGLDGWWRERVARKRTGSRGARAPPAQASVRAADEGSRPTAAVAGAPPTRQKSGGNRGSVFGCRDCRCGIGFRKGWIEIAIIKLKTTMKKTN